RRPSRPCAGQPSPAIHASCHPPAHLAPAATTPWHQDESWWPSTKPAFVSVGLAPRNQTTKTAGTPAKSQQPLQYPGESDAAPPEARSGASIPSPAGTAWFPPTAAACHTPDDRASGARALFAASHGPDNWLTTSCRPAPPNRFAGVPVRE